MEEMSWVSSLIMLSTGVLLPTFDVYSDILFAIKLLTLEPPAGQCLLRQAGTQKYAAAMLTPPIISWLFVAYQWFRIEVGTKCKLMTLPFLFLQVYPQWRALRVLYYGKWKKQSGWKEMKDKWETEICNLGESP